MALADDAEAWLGTKNVSLWSDWYIDSPDRRRLAAQWFVDQLIEFAHFRPVDQTLQMQQQEARRA